MQLHLNALKSKYQATDWNTLLDELLYPILLKLEEGSQLSEKEIDWLRKNYFAKTAAIALEMGREIERFVALKAKYQATQHHDSSASSHLYQILRCLDTGSQLDDLDINWLKQHELLETLAIYQQQEAAREAEFDQLKTKYQATQYQDSSAASPLVSILRRLDKGK